VLAEQDETRTAATSTRSREGLFRFLDIVHSWTADIGASDSHDQRGVLRCRIDENMTGTHSPIA
jgi:hypothetical protein